MASMIAAPEESQNLCGIFAPCSTPYGINDSCTVAIHRWITPRACAQRLMASMIAALLRYLFLNSVMKVLNALWHQ